MDEMIKGSDKLKEDASYSSNAKKTVQIKDPSLKEKDSSTIISQTSQKFTESHKLEDQINLQHLVELMTIFHTADENGSDGLDIDEFRAAFGQILGKGKNDQQMAIMFMKIDTNCDGTLDWDEFCTYMLLEYQEKDSMKGEEESSPFPYPLKQLPNPHRNILSRITALTNVTRGGNSNRNGEDYDSNPGKEGNIVTVSKDGLICFWKRNLTLNRTIQLECKKPKLMWVTDMVVMPNVHKMLLSFTDCVLAVHDLLTPTFQKVFHITALPHCAVTLDYWYDDSDYDHSVLTFGDTGGGVCFIEFSNATRNLFGVAATAKHDCVRMSFPELQHHKFKDMKTTYLSKVHIDWVNKVKYCPIVEGVISCSCDSNASMVISNINYRKENNIFQVLKGLNTFDYSKEWNVIVTGGKDTDLRLWNPYVSTKPITLLKGHTTAIMHVTIVHLDGLILSFSKDMELRVWSIQDHLCLQTCHRFQHMDIQIPCMFYYHSPTASLLVGSNNLGTLELYHDDKQKNADVISHDSPLCGALYNSSFNQVVSACHGSVVSVWEIETGEKTIQFTKCHGNVEITAMAFDPTGRRLVTGARDGSIKIWNFNNGACLSVLETDYNTEVTCFCFLKQKLMVSGWSGLVSEYSDLRDPDDIVPKYWGNGIHKEDILCIAPLEPDVLVTASYDGDVVLWDVEIEQPIVRLNKGSSYTGQQFIKQQKKLKAIKIKKMECEQEKGKKSNNKRKSDSFTTTIPTIPSNVSNYSNNSTFGYKDNTAIESLVFLPERQHNTDTANLIIAGASGIVQFWNTFGGGLIGEFSVFDDTRIRTVACIKEEDLKMLHGVTACKIHSNNELLFIGTSLGHIQEWNISNYCIDIQCDLRPVRQTPVMVKAWKGHFSSIVSIDLAEEKELIVTASTDRCVSLWSFDGRYIGTFGEKQQWRICDLSNLPRKVPPGLHQVASFNTIQTVAGPSQSKWRLARQLFKQLSESKHVKNATKATGKQSEETSDESYNDKILGEAYKRKVPYRKPVKRMSIKTSDHQVLVYSSLLCTDLIEPEITLPSLNILECDNDTTSESDMASADTVKSFPKNPFTEKTLLPKLNGCQL